MPSDLIIWLLDSKPVGELNRLIEQSYVRCSLSDIRRSIRQVHTHFIDYGEGE